MRRYASASALASRLGVSVAEIEARATPWRERGARAVLVLGLGWVSVIDSEAPILGLTVTPTPNADESTDESTDELPPEVVARNEAVVARDAERDAERTRQAQADLAQIDARLSERARAIRAATKARAKQPRKRRSERSELPKGNSNSHSHRASQS